VSSALRWLEQDDPRLAGKLGRAARVAEWVESQFVAP
jgi:hypothetical protein